MGTKRGDLRDKLTPRGNDIKSRSEATQSGSGSGTRESSEDCGGVDAGLHTSLINS